MSCDNLRLFRVLLSSVHSVFCSSALEESRPFRLSWGGGGGGGGEGGRGEAERVIDPHLHAG